MRETLPMSVTLPAQKRKPNKDGEDASGQTRQTNSPGLKYGFVVVGRGVTQV